MGLIFGNTMLLNPDTIKQLKADKSLITPELLEALRAKGNDGKQLCLDILDTEKSDDEYYLDSFGVKISFNGNRNLKRAFTKMDLSPIHLQEIEKCSNDFYYFRNNYLKIKTPHGITFPDFRPYQNEFIKHILSPEESLISMQPRQAGKSITIGSWMNWKFIFSTNITMGICGNNAGLAREFLNNIKDMFLLLPLWLTVGVKVWNAGSIASESNTRILTAAPSANSFRGFTCNVIVVDECAFFKPSVWKEFADSIFPSQSALTWKKNIIISTANGLNHFSEIWKGSEKRKVLKNVAPNAEIQMKDGSIITVEDYYKTLL